MMELDPDFLSKRKNGTNLSNELKKCGLINSNKYGTS